METYSMFRKGQTLWLVCGICESGEEEVRLQMVWGLDCALDLAVVTVSEEISRVTEEIEEKPVWKLL
jgi:hypothetical protein